MSGLVGEIVLVNIGQYEPVWRPAVVLHERADGTAFLHAFVRWSDVPLPAQLRALTSTMGYEIEAASEGEGIGQWRRRGLLDSE